MRKFILTAAISTVSLFALTSPSMAASGGACTLNGTANFGTPLGMTAQNFNYSFSGTLSNCQSSVSGAPTAGTVSAGGPITIGGVTYQEPAASGNGSCASSTTSGIAIVQWNDGTTTVERYSTNGAAAAVALTGSVISGVTVTNGSSSTTVSTTRYSGDSTGGALAFEPPDPTACNGAGVSSAGIQGELGLGTQN